MHIKGFNPEVSKMLRASLEAKANSGKPGGVMISRHESYMLKRALEELEAISYLAAHGAIIQFTGQEELIINCRVKVTTLPLQTARAEGPTFKDVADKIKEEEAKNSPLANAIKDLEA